MHRKPRKRTMPYQIRSLACSATPCIMSRKSRHRYGCPDILEAENRALAKISAVRSAHIEKRPPRARRPALPQPRAAVLSAKAGLTAGFGMGPGDPRLCGRARGGRSPAALMYGACQEPLSGATLAAAWRARKKITHRARCLSSRMRRARAISAARLSASPRLHLRPIDQVVYLGPYRRVDSSRRRLPA